MLDFTNEELKKLNNFKRKHKIDPEVFVFTEQVLYLYEEMLFFAQKNHDKELFKKIDFQGFHSDASSSDESEYCDYAELLILKLNKYPTIKSTIKDDKISNDIWQIIRYANQLEIWENHHKPSSDEMTKEIIEKILNA